MGKKGKTFGALLFFCYGVCMLWLLFGQRLDEIPKGEYCQLFSQRLILTPFRTIGRFWRVLRHSTNPQNLRLAAVNLVGNVVMFMPLGFFPPLLWKKTKKFWQVLLFTILVILGVELLQSVTLLGYCDIDDVILNLAGALTGYGIWKLISKKSPE